ATVTVAPSTSSVAVASTVSLSATLKNANNTTLTGRIMTWSVDNSSIATVTSAGVVTNVASGTATVTATSEDKSETATVTVTAAGPAPVATVTIAPSTSTVRISALNALFATLKNAAGNTLTGRTVTWSSSNSAVASVNSNGVVTG